MHAVDRPLLDALSAEAQAAPRRRKNKNFHATAEAPCQRLLNAIEPDSYVRPHRHLDKAEMVFVVRGRLGLLEFDDAGEVRGTTVLVAGGDVLGAEVQAGTFHSWVSLEPGTIFFEAKDGPYQPAGPAEVADWAPAEGEPEAGAFLENMRARVLA